MTKENEELTEDVVEYESHGELTEDVLDVASLGKSRKLTNTRRAEFSYALCEKHLDLRSFVGERPLRDDHITYLTRAMQQGTFANELVQLAVCFLKEDGREYGINGRHTCWARLNLPEDWHQEQAVHVVQVLHYEAATLDDLRQLYTVRDRQAGRTKANVIVAHLAGTTGYGEFSNRLTKLLSEGLARWLNVGGGSNISRKLDGDELSFLMKTTHFNICTTVGRFASVEPTVITTGFLRRAAVVAAMLETFTKSAKAGLEFWTAVKTGENLAANDPRLKLRNELMRTVQAANAKKNPGGLREATAEQLYTWCIMAWNHWRAGGVLQKLQGPREGNIPKAK